MSLRDWQHNSWLVAHDTSAEEIAALLAIVERDLANAGLAGLAEDWNSPHSDTGRFGSRCHSAIRQRYGLEEASVLALQATVDMLLISQNQGKVERGAAERVNAGIRQALRDGRLSPKPPSVSIERVRALRGRIAQ